jgi:hypothetical protein
MSSQGALESAVVVARRRGGGGQRGARPGFALGAAEEAPSEDDVDSDDEEADEIDSDFDPDDDVTPASTSEDAPDLTSTSQVTTRDLDDDDLIEAFFAAAEVPAAEKAALDVFGSYVNACAPEAFARAVPRICSLESLAEKILLQCQFQQLDRPAAAAAANKNGYELAPEEVRAGAPRPLPSSVDCSTETPVVVRTSALARVTVARRAGR